MGPILGVVAGTKIYFITSRSCYISFFHKFHVDFKFKALNIIKISVISNYVNDWISQINQFANSDVSSSKY